MKCAERSQRKSSFDLSHPSMAKSYQARFLIFCVATSAAILSQGSTKTQKPVYYTFCFWDGLSRWRPAPHNFSVSDIPAELCSAVVYSHVTIDDKTGSIKLTEQELKLDPEARAYSKSFIYNPIWMLPPHRAFRQLNDLKKRNPKLKILLAVGGPRDPVEKYWQFFRAMHLWRDTVLSLAQWLKTYDFDGVVFDFFSGTSTAQDSIRTWDTARLIHPFLRDIRTKFQVDYITDWRIVLTLPAFDSVTQRLFDIGRLSEVVNFFFVKTNDCLEFPKGSGLNVPRSMDMTDIDRAELVVQRGGQRLSVVLDIPLSGSTYSAMGSGSGVHTVFTGRAGPYTKQQGFLSSYEVCDQLRSGWTQERFGEEACPFLRHDEEFVAYEDEQSILQKAKMVMGRKYRGVAIRTVDLDDYTGSCAGKTQLLKTLRSSFDAASLDHDLPYYPPNETWWGEDLFSTRNPFRPHVKQTLSMKSATTPSQPDTTTPNPQGRDQTWGGLGRLGGANGTDRPSTRANVILLETPTTVPSVEVPMSEGTSTDGPSLHATPPVIEKSTSVSGDAIGMTSPEAYTMSPVPAVVAPKQKSDICEGSSSNNLLPHETDCSKYYQCVHSTPHVKTCAPNTIFDIERQICNWPALTNRPECII
ncbi:chitinase-3-like protein 1 [Amblyomma americanum]